MKPPTLSLLILSLVCNLCHCFNVYLIQSNNNSYKKHHYTPTTLLVFPREVDHVTIKHEHCLPGGSFAVDKSSNSILYQPPADLQEHSALCSVQVQVRVRETQAIFPLVVRIIPEDTWSQNSETELNTPTSRVFLQPSVSKSVLKHMLAHSCAHSGGFVPTALCKCSSSKPRSMKHSVSRRSVYVDYESCELQPGLYLPSQRIKFSSNIIPNYLARRKRRSAENSGLRRKRYGVKQLKCGNDEYTAAVMENKAAGTYVFTIKASDQSGAAVPDITYTMSAMTNVKSNSKFHLNSTTGVITTTMPLDRENMDSHTFNVYASARDMSINQARCRISIRVRDENDNRPMFTQTIYTEEIHENLRNGTYVLQVHADDADEGANSRIDFSISEHHPDNTTDFRINSDGEIFVDGTIDREQTPNYTLIICATDNGSPMRSKKVNVTILVLDSNDNYPQFKEAQYVFSVSENAKVNYNVGKVNATDEDEGKNGQVLYRLSRGDPNRKFSINADTGEIRLMSRLDYETDYNGFQLSIRASDMGRPPKYNNTGKVIIHVTDVNDNKPRFIGGPYNVSVPENLQKGAKVLEVQAVDDDHGANSKIVYSIQPRDANLPFIIPDKSKGLLILSKPLDYEHCKTYKFKVVATDSDKRRTQSSDAYVEVGVRDVNDNAPNFEYKRYVVTIGEDTVLNKMVALVKATDPDKVATVSINYAITGGNEGREFNIASQGNEGEIFLEKTLDYNRQKSYSLTITASDGKLSNTTTVVINVADKNSYRPVFDKDPYEVEVSEDISIGENVTQVLATDRDIGENARITYCFVDENCPFDSDRCCPTRQNNYEIDKLTGVITTTGKLDYEDSSFVMLNIKAHDHGVPSRYERSSVQILLKDVNDNAPVFSQKIYRGNISENVKRRWEILQVHATDNDSEQNSQIIYELKEGEDGDGNFDIDKRTGRVRAIHSLDRENVDQYQLTVLAIDNGIPKQTSSAIVIIDVLDEDDNPPIFSDDVLYFHIKEDTPENSEIATIQAYDPDISKSVIRYEIGHDPIALSVFDLTKSTGQLRLIRQLDYEKRQNYTFTVSATSGELINQVVVHVLVIDCNDNAPVFNNFEIHFNNYWSDELSSFYSDVIGKVPAYDPDASDKLTYRFVAGNEGNLVIMNETTGSLQLNSTLDSNRQFTAKMKILVSDGLLEHDVNATCTLRVTGITAFMLRHSITVRVLSMNAYKFLSPLFYQFTAGLANILGTAEKNIFIFNVQNDTDVDREILNVSFSALREHPNHFFTSKHLQDQVYLNRTKLADLTTMNVLPFDDNICLREPCQNYKRCTSVLSFNSTASFVSSASMIFRPIYPVYSLKCECPIGFTNDESCTDEINLCYSKPCENGGVCQPVEGDFYCECPNGYTGKQCHVNMRMGSCKDHPDVCRNNGECVDISGGGFECKCTSSNSFTNGKNEFTSLCELRSRKFKAGDFLMLPGIVNQWHFELSISFATVEANGLIFYNGRLNHENDFLAMELVDGQVRLNFSTGQDTTVADPVSVIPLNDGKWHTVHLQYFNERKPGQLRYGVLSHHGPSRNKVVIVTVDPEDCDERLSEKLKLNCTRRVEQAGVKTSLDLTSPLLLGGVPNLPEEFQVRSKHFTGCLRDLVIDGQRSDLASYIANRGSEPGCASMRDQCSENSCHNNGKCETRWNTYSCECPEGTTGINCERRSIVKRLNGAGYLNYANVDQLPRLNLPWGHTFSFRTRQTNATILHLQTNSVYQRTPVLIDVKIENGKLLYEVHEGSKAMSMRTNTIPLNTGEWQFVDVDWRTNKDLISVSVNINYGEEVIKKNVFFQSFRSRIPIKILTIGGDPQGRGVPLNGCIQSFIFQFAEGNSRLLEGGLSAQRGARVTSNCDTPTSCRSSNSCPANSECISKWSQYKCNCIKGYIGANCTSVCDFHPCKDASVCQLDPSTPRGYKCVCHPGYTGESCQFKLSGDCPDGWFGGEGLCAPCNCSADDNYDLKCERKTGKCHCKENHYFMSATGACHPCNCYTLGSKFENCTSEHGKCDCKGSVYGEKCDTCAYKFSEIQQNGCKVLQSDESCPKERKENIIWRRTLKGKHDIQKCPTGVTGFTIRVCRKDGWVNPNFSNCTNKLFDFFVEFLQKQKQENTYLSSALLGRLATRLRNATDLTSTYYSSDIEVSADVIRLLLDYQNSQTGFGLTTSRESTFTSDLVRVSSAIVDNATTHFWNLGATSKGKGTGLSAPYLLHTWQEYLSTLLMNADRIHLDASTNTPTPNVKFTLNTLNNPNRADSYTKIREDITVPEVSFSLPSSLFVTRTYRKMDRSPRSLEDPSAEVSPLAIGVMTYDTVKNILPISFELNRSYRIPKKPAVNSHVVTFVVRYRQLAKESLPSNERARVDEMFDENGILRELTGEGIEISFKLFNTNNVIDPHCVFWNFTSTRTSLETFGAWSQRACTKSYSNKTHVVCRCHYNGTVAVITDEEVTSVMGQASVYTTITIAIALSAIFLLILIMAQVCLSAVNSVRSVVNRNLAVSFALSILCFLVGIRQTSDLYWCMAFAVILHFFILSNFAWIVVDILHIYRTLTERRNVNHGHSRIYYLIGWIIPSVITALSLGLDAKGFGNTEFCWISWNDLLKWSFVAPTLLSCGIFVILFSLSLNAYLASKRVDMKRDVIKHEMRSSVITIIGSVSTWFFASIAVNLNSSIYFYLFAVIVLAQSVVMFVLNLWKNDEMMEGYKTYQKRQNLKKARNQTFEHLLPSIGRTPESSSAANSHMLRTGNSASETQSLSKPYHPGLMVPMFNAELSDSYDDDSDDDVSCASSRSSMSLDSSSYSDADDEDDEEEVTQRNTLRNIRNCRVIPPSPPTTTTSSKRSKSNHLRPRFDDEIKPMKGNGTSRTDEVMFKLTPPVVAISDEKINTDDSDETSL